MPDLNLIRYNILEAAVPPERTEHEELYYTTSPIMAGSFYAQLAVTPASRYLSTPRGYTVHLTAINADTGAVLFERPVQSNHRIGCRIPPGHRVTFWLSLPPSEKRRVGIFRKQVWNPRVTLFVGAGTSGRVVDESLL